MLGKGIVEAQHAIGLKYFEGTGVEKDYQKAAEWYEKAAKNRDDRVATNLGNLYRDGLGVLQSTTKAFKLFKFAVECGNTTAMMNLADCYFNASGTGSIVASKEDITEGIKPIIRDYITTK
uniref:Sel1 repeat family protein n=1 Tax=Panagrolaimus sp. PS1159 TaxID=55785 RepID=A0AC35FT74_9BILA